MINIKQNRAYFNILGMRINLVQIPEIINCISVWIENKERGNYIVVSNAYDVVAGKKDERIRNAVNASSLSIPDGISLVLFARLNGRAIKKRAYGPDLMLDFLKLAEIKGYYSFFYGTTQDTLKSLIINLKLRFPALKVAGSYAPPFRSLTVAEDKEIANIINLASPDVIWVGLGTPKQQLWMYDHRERINAPVMIGVGAAFDFLAGIKPQAPRWIRDNGFEWLFRLITEPKRLWRRYLIDYPLFVYYVLVELASKPIKSLLNK